MSDNNAKLIDQEHLRLISGENGEMLKMLIPIFEDEAEKDLSAIQEALESSDFSELEKSAHRLKGSSKTIGAVGVASICLKLEDASRAKDKSLCQEVRENLLEVLSTTKEVFSKMT